MFFKFKTAWSKWNTLYIVQELSPQKDVFKKINHSGFTYKKENHVFLKILYLENTDFSKTCVVWKVQ